MRKKPYNPLFKEGDRHRYRIKQAWQRLETAFPLTAEQLDNADEALVEHIDQFVYRFTKLQDSMGTKEYTKYSRTGPRDRDFYTFVPVYPLLAADVLESWGIAINIPAPRGGICWFCKVWIICGIHTPYHNI